MKKEWEKTDPSYFMSGKVKPEKKTLLEIVNLTILGVAIIIMPIAVGIIILFNIK